MAKARSWGKKQAFLKPEGQVRGSQVITTYGAGALIDLVDQAVLVGGLDFWSYGSEKGIPIIHEPRLRDALAERFKMAGRELAFENAFREPPAGDLRQASRNVGIQVLEMPRWFVCQNQLPSSGSERRPGAQAWAPLPSVRKVPTERVCSGAFCGGL